MATGGTVRQGGLDIDTLSDAQGVLEFNAKVAHCAIAPLCDQAEVAPHGGCRFLDRSQLPLSGAANRYQNLAAVAANGRIPHRIAKLKILRGRQNPRRVRTQRKK